VKEIKTYGWDSVVADGRSSRRDYSSLSSFLADTFSPFAGAGSADRLKTQKGDFA
jgi:hypothetical protein